VDFERRFEEFDIVVTVLLPLKMGKEESQEMVIMLGIFLSEGGTLWRMEWMVLTI